MIKNIFLIGHKSFASNEIKKILLKKKNFKLFFLTNYFSEKDLFLLDKKKFYKKYFSKYNKIDVIISCLHIHKEKAKDELSVNIKAYKNILYFSKMQKVKKIIYLSSVNVSKDKSKSYAFTKYKIEKLLNKYYNSIIIRPSTIISIDSNKKLLGGKDGSSFNLFEKLFKYNFPIPIIGDGKYLFTFCFVGDLAKFILLLINTNIFLNKKINFFSGELINFDTFIDYIAKIKKKKIYKIYLPLAFINFLCKIRIFKYKNIYNLLNQRIHFDYCHLIKKKLKINQLKNIAEKNL